MLKLKNIIEQTQGVINVKDPKQAADLAKQGLEVNLTETELDEANLLNTIHDYRGGVEWVLFDKQYAKHVMSDISEWATKKGFDIITRKISKNGKLGYIYFRLGEDPAKESQRIQGYVAQTPEIKYFRFNVRGQKKIEAPAAAPTAPAPQVAPQQPSF
jgi:hypothetical protein